ncbi:MAG TPA: hypothetical protein ENK43_10760 [Planctomycetes bacterium]|nr:hypothetical protein [Planctomycetota bacterium]
MTRTKRSLGMTLAVVACLTLFLGGGAWVLTDDATHANAASFRIEAALPTDCLLHVSYDGVAGAKNCRNLALSQLWEEPQMKAFLQPAMEMLDAMSEEMASELEQNTGLSLADLESLGEGRLTFTIVDLAIEDPNGPPDMDALITLDLGSNKELAGKLAQMAAGAAEQGMGVAPTEVTIAGNQGLAFDLDGLPAYLVAAGNHLVLGTNKTTLGGVLDRVKAGVTSGGLIDNADFTSAMEKVSPMHQGVFSVYANLGKFVHMLENSPAAEEREFGMVMAILDVTGLTKFQSVAYGMNFEGRAIVERFHISAPDGLDKTLYGAMPAGNGKFRVLDMAPQNSLMAEGFRLDMSVLADRIMAALSDFDKDMAANVDEELKAMTDQLGFSVMDDLLPSIGQEMGFWMAPSPFGGLIPEMMVAVQLKDSDKFFSCIDKASAMLPREGAMRSFEFMSHEIHYLDTGMLVNRSDDFGPGIKPAWMVDDGYLMVGLAPQALKNYLASKSHQRSGLASNADLVEAMTHFRRSNPEAGNTGVVYIDTGRLMIMAIDTLLPILQSVDLPDEVPVDLALLPTTDVFQRHIFGFTEAVSQTNTSLTTEIYSCTGYMPMAIGAGAAIGASMAMGRIDSDNDWDEWEDDK